MNITQALVFAMTLKTFLENKHFIEKSSYGPRETYSIKDHLTYVDRAWEKGIKPKSFYSISRKHKRRYNLSAPLNDSYTSGEMCHKLEREMSAHAELIEIIAPEVGGLSSETIIGHWGNYLTDISICTPKAVPA